MDQVKKAIFDDVIVVTVDGAQKKFILVRQFHNFQKLIIRVKTTDGVINDISITADAAYANTDFKGWAFEFPSVTDYYRFAKFADENSKLACAPACGQWPLAGNTHQQPTHGKSADFGMH